MTKARLTLVSTTFAVLFTGCKAKTDQPTLAALQALQKLSAHTETGITNVEYHSLLGDAQLALTQYNVVHTEHDLVGRSLNSSLQDFKDAGDIWDLEIRLSRGDAGFDSCKGYAATLCQQFPDLTEKEDARGSGALGINYRHAISKAWEKAANHVNIAAHEVQR